ESGALDVPFAPCRATAGLMRPARDNTGAARLLTLGHLPSPQELNDFHREKLEERARYEKRQVSFQMVIDDVYAIGKGWLVGRPRH
ncbi:MAG: methylaspartate mutase subunit E, partial [Oscillospiraceae bacterium]|nr:methylaspartate mutase subunit E [Oscillospiraceae bacterium]